jgi:hypothetical protein
MVSSLLRLSRRIGLATALVALVAFVARASAYLIATGTGRASASTGTLSSPGITSATSGAGTVTLKWSAVTPPAGVGGVTYYVSRNGGAPAGDCPTSTGLEAVTSCTDTGLSKGSYSYTVTAVWRSWTATSLSTQATVSFGAVSKFVFTTEPDGSPTGGVAFPQQPVVTALDAGGNTVTNYSGTVTLSITSGTPTSGGPGNLSGCSGTLSNGVTSFAGCKINTSGNGYKLDASDGTLTATSTAFNVSVGPASKLLFTTQPDGSPTGGVAFPQQPVVTALDAGGNTVTNYSGTVALSITSGTPTSGGPGTLSGCSGTLSNGVTSFAGCKINTSGNGYKLDASDGTLTATSTAFNVSVGPASKLLFTTQPDGSPTGGVAFPQQPVVTAQDAGGNTVTNYSGTVALSIKSGTGATGATLSGCTGTRTSGVITFTGCQIDKAANNYQLNANDGTLTTTSTAFNVAVGPATKLLFTTQPDGSPTAGQPFPTQPVVTVEDAGGNTVSSYTTAITLSIQSGTGTLGATLNGCTPSLVSGVDSFSGCSINDPGTGYQLSANSGSLSATSSAFGVTGLTATSVAEVTGPGTQTPVATASVPPVNGSTYLIFVYCSGQSASCNSGNANATVSSPAFSSVTFDEAVGTGRSSGKDCLEVFTATGSNTSGAVTVTPASGQVITYVNVVQLSAGALVQNGPSFPNFEASSSPATATLSSPNANDGELVPVGVSDGTSTITIATPTGWTLLGTSQSGAASAAMSVFFDPTAQSSFSSTLSPVTPTNGWATYAIEVGA